MTFPESKPSNVQRVIINYVIVVEQHLGHERQVSFFSALFSGRRGTSESP